MHVLVINSGSSSIKYQLFEAAGPVVLAAGVIEKIGESSSRIKHTLLTSDPATEIVKDLVVADHRQGLAHMVTLLMDADVGIIDTPEAIQVIGHRVVHGGERFSQPAIIDDQVIAAVRELIPLAPLHNPANLTGIEVAVELFPNAVQVAVFDTAFHQTMPAPAYRYAIPRHLYEQHSIRVYGFHGTSHLYVTRQAIAYLGKPAGETNLITAHLGNGASMTAVKGGQSVDTSMGFSPLAGLIMGTRSGDIDPAIPYFLGSSLDLSFAEIDRLLNKQSGLLGLTGNNDLRDIEARREQGDVDAQLAMEMVAYRIKKYIGAYYAALGRVDGLVFTAGIGEHSALLRRLACAGLENLGISLDLGRNEDGAKDQVTEIQADNSPVKVLIIPTNEELEIAIQALGVIKNA